MFDMLLKAGSQENSKGKEKWEAQGRPAAEGPGCGMLYVPDILQGQSGTMLIGSVLSDFLKILVL